MAERASLAEHMGDLRPETHLDDFEAIQKSRPKPAVEAPKRLHMVERHARAKLRRPVVDWTAHALLRGRKQNPERVRVGRETVVANAAEQREAGLAIPADQPTRLKPIELLWVGEVRLGVRQRASSDPPQ